MSWGTSPGRVAALNLISCHCNDTCGAASLANAPFRKDQGLQAFIYSDVTDKLTSSEFVWAAYSINALFIGFIILQGLLGLIQTNFTQAEFRNNLFLLLGGQKPYVERSNTRSKARYHAARCIALSFFAGSTTVALIAPAIFISSLIINEIVAFGYPVGESSDAVGQVNVPYIHLLSVV